MKILSVNAGSSSLKFTLFEMPAGEELISGTFERIGINNSFYSIKLNGEKIKKEVELDNHKTAVKYLIDELLTNKIIVSLEELEGIGHRVVNGGEYNKSIIIDDEFLNVFPNYFELAPLHNPVNMVGIEAFKEYLPNTLMTAVFDTSFHQTMKKTEYLYATPYEWYENYGVRKYGYHGTSHRYVDLTIREHLGQNDLKVITCHLGNGSSITAINSKGEVVDTSMGFTPLVGLIMGTRTGDNDASIIPYIMKKENKTVDEVMNDLNKKSGFLGISGVSSDSRDIENGAEEGNELCDLTQKMAARRVANYVAMYNNLLEGSDVICFTAGIGENSALTRQMVIDNLKSLGVKIDPQLNDVRGKFRKISTEDSKIMVYIVPTNEELMIAKDTYELVTKE